ncbi:hypothetical protein GF336_07550 [Candidatus Woesearchaeota archaeon]|nr:hypothetical protein [Candidatus Woesearchaeota archaeon]
MKKALLIVAQNGYQPVEYVDTKDELEKAGVSVTVASFEKAEAIASDGSKIMVDMGFNDVDVSDYSAVVLIGGPGSEVELRGNEKVKEIVQSADNAHKVIAAICYSPVILAEARLLKDRKAAVWNLDGKQKEILAAEGATYSEEDVVIDTRIITANGPAATRDFGKAIVKVLEEQG